MLVQPHFRGLPSWRLALLVLLAILPCPATALSQQVIVIRARVFGGMLNPRGDIPDAPILDAPENVLSYDDLEAQASFGLGLELRPGGLPLGLRLSSSRAFGHEATGRWGCVPGVACPAILIEGILTDVTTTVAAADVLADLPTGSDLKLHPFVGVAWVRYGYKWDPTPVGSFSLEPGSYAVDSAALRFGAGASYPIGPLRLDVEYAEHLMRSGPPRPTAAGTLHAGVSFPLR